MNVELFAKLDGKMFRLTPCEEEAIEDQPAKGSCSIIPKSGAAGSAVASTDCTIQEQVKALSGRLKEATSLTSLGVILWGEPGKGKIFRLLRDFGMIGYTEGGSKRHWHPTQHFKKFFTEEVLYLKNMTHPVVTYRIRKEAIEEMAEFILTLDKSPFDARKSLLRDTVAVALMEVRTGRWGKQEDAEQGQLKLGF